MKAEVRTQGGGGQKGQTERQADGLAESLRRQRDQEPSRLGPPGNPCTWSRPAGDKGLCQDVA